MTLRDLTDIKTGTPMYSCTAGQLGAKPRTALIPALKRRTKEVMGEEGVSKKEGGKVIQRVERTERSLTGKTTIAYHPIH